MKCFKSRVCAFLLVCVISINAEQVEVGGVMPDGADHELAERTRSYSGFGAAIDQAFLSECEVVELEVPPQWMVVLGTVFSRCYTVCVQCSERVSRGYCGVSRWIRKTLTTARPPKKLKKSSL